MALAPSTAEQELESLTQFLYIAPIGLVQASIDGEILLINPKSAQLLLPLAPQGELTNLFDVLDSVVPDLRLRIAAYRQPCGLVCENVPLRISGGGRGERAPQVLSLTLLKLDDSRLMAVVDDISASLRRDEALRRSHSWISSFLAGIDHYALLPLDRQGQVAAWNAGVERVTGFDAQRSVGRSHAMFHADDAEDVQQSLARADREGWSLDDGWHRRADGSRYWGSSLVVPAAPIGASDSTAPAYNLVIRDISGEHDARESQCRDVAVDHLTGLANRWAFFEAAEVHWRRWVRASPVQPLTLLLFDVDAVPARHSDTAPGDAALCHVAAHLAMAFEAGAARVGSARFAVLLPGVGMAAAEAAAGRVCRAIAAAPVRLDDAALFAVTARAGVATMGPDVTGVDDLLDHADAALRKARALADAQVAGGRSRVPAETL